MLGALAARGDVAARGAVQAALSSGDPAVRLAAIKALGTLGDESFRQTVGRSDQAGGPAAERQAARNSLVHLRGPRINEVLTGLLSQNDPGRQAELIRILAARNAVSSVAALEKAAEAADGTVRKEAWKALGGLARTPDVPALLELLVRVRDEERDDAEKAVGAVLARPDRPDLRAVLQKLETVEAPAARGLAHPARERRRRRQRAAGVAPRPSSPATRASAMPRCAGWLPGRPPRRSKTW